MVLKNYSLRRGIAFILTCLFFLVIYYFISKPNPPLVLTEKEVIQDEIRYTVIPLSLSDTDPCKIHLKLESFEHSDIISLDPTEQALLSDNTDSFSEPTRWEEETATEFKKVGTLYFPPINKEAKTVTLSLFFSNEVQIEFERKQ